jgi:hypothetical protein
MSPKLARIARMDAAEAAWRGRTAARNAAQRTAFALRQPQWNRAALASALAPDAALAAVRRALSARNWHAANRALQRHVIERSPRFVLRPADRASIAARINRLFPRSAAAAAARADRILAGEYDLLGYQGLRFGAADPDWHTDPVHGRTAPRTFWASVPYLDPVCGDHKIIWELNRHQHWLALGRAFWLTGDPRYRRRCIAELTGWMSANPPLAGINWASMLELGLRSLSWIWALHLFASPDAHDDAAWSVDLLLGLDRQLTHVERNLSYYFSPNTHLLGEALALYVSGRALPELAASPRRADTGRRILIAEIGRQIADDGGHCERSTHYHRYTLDFYLLALATARATGDPIAAAFERAVVRLAAAARVLVDDRGRPPHLGDDDGGQLFPIAGRDCDDWRDSLALSASLTGREEFRIDSRCEEEFWLLGGQRQLSAVTAPAETRAISTALEQTGYFISRSRAGDHLIIDGGRHGYQNGGHAHADALSMTLTVRGRPLLIDPGTACYTIDAERRDRFRSTAAHNTLTVDGRPQSVGSGPFHWAHTADAALHRWRTTDGFDYFDGSHDGYAASPHRRRVFVLRGDLIAVADYIGGDGARHSAAAHWHIAPEWNVDVRGTIATCIADGERVNLLVPQGRIESFWGDAESGLGWHSPVYGRVEPATTLRLALEAPTPFWIISVFDLNTSEPISRLDCVPVWAEAGALAEGTALRITRERSIDYLLIAEPVRPIPRASWRVADFETDARMLFCRLAPTGDISRVALVDGSFVRSSGRRALGIALGRVTPAVFIDETSIRNFTPCAASPGL